MIFSLNVGWNLYQCVKTKCHSSCKLDINWQVFSVYLVKVLNLFCKLASEELMKHQLVAWADLGEPQGRSDWTTPSYSCCKSVDSGRGRSLKRSPIGQNGPKWVWLRSSGRRGVILTELSLCVFLELFQDFSLFFSTNDILMNLSLDTALLPYQSSN